MATSPSQLPIRRQQNDAMRRSVSHTKTQLPSSDIDELGDDTIPCSPTALLRQSTPITQPTQILSRPSLQPSLRSSSPVSVVEVPASSPFQMSETSKRVSRLAPAGTLFRPPVRPKQPATIPKRPAPDPINLISDDEDDLAPTRGDILPTSFKSHVSSFAYNAYTPTDEEIKVKLYQIYEVFGEKYPSELVRKALRLKKYDMNDAIEWLESSASKEHHPTPPASNASSRKLISKASVKDASNMDRSQSLTQHGPSPSEPPKPPKRRLIQGLRKRLDSSPGMAPPPPSSDDPLVVIDLTEAADIEKSRQDEYKAARSPSPIGKEDDRVLNCINSSTLKELGAMTGMKEALLEPIIEKRPFESLLQAKRLSVSKKPGSRKAARLSIGESVVDAVEVFLNAASAIDEVVAKCETKGQTVKSVMDTWDLDSFGFKKGSRRASPEADLPLTPRSLGGPKFSPPLVPKQPNLMNGHCQMKPFQLFGLNWMTLLYNYDIGCILADEMGLGKTCQVISFICQLVESDEQKPRQRRPWPNLIVVPPSTYKNWLMEFDRFAPGLSVIGYRGSQAERAGIAFEIQQDLDEYHVVLATYSQINSEEDIEAMQSFDLNATIFDEGHKMKNPETKVYNDLRRIPSAWKMLLTGTPVQNNLLEMTSLLNFINPKMFDGYMDDIRYIFSQKVTIRDVSNGAFLYSERVKRARTILEPFILQRRKDQVLADLPSKTCTVVHCQLNKAQRLVYDEYETVFKKDPSERAKQAKGRQNDFNNVWMQLRKAALHPLLFRRHFTDSKIEKMSKILMDRVPQSELHQPDIKHLIQELKNSSDFELHLWCRDYPRFLKDFDISPSAKLESGKVEKLLELIEQYQKNGDRVLIFSKFSRVIELLQEVLALEGIDHRVLQGMTNVSERQTLIDEFNQNADIPVFLLTTGAGGTGINLTSANKVIIFDQSDNPQDDIQAENRAHRLGQTRDVEVIRLIATQTIEELIYKACQKKIELANKVTGAIEEDHDVEGNLEKEVRKMMKGQLTPPL